MSIELCVDRIIVWDNRLRISGKFDLTIRFGQGFTFLAKTLQNLYFLYDITDNK